jgi:hypothetical protein
MTPPTLSKLTQTQIRAAIEDGADPTALTATTPSPIDLEVFIRTVPPAAIKEMHAFAVAFEAAQQTK